VKLHAISVLAKPECLDAARIRAGKNRRADRKLGDLRTMPLQDFQRIGERAESRIILAR
jgi:hypothetical protein